jgi:ABC-type multidrug transport system fused ATPase/permease subunit
MLTRLLRSFLRPYIRQVAIVVSLLVAQTIGNLYLPNLNADIINNGVEKGDIHYIFTTGGVMLAIALAVGVLAIVAVYWASRVAMGAGADLRAAVFTQVQSFSAREVNRFGTPSLITRNTNDIQQIQLFLQMGLTIMVIAPIMCVGGMIMAVKEGAVLSLLLVVAVPVMAVVIGAMLIMVVPQFRVMQVKIDRINQVLREQITGVRVIRAFVRTRPEAQRFGEANADLTATALRVNRVFALAMPALMAILNLSSVAVLWFGGRLVSEGSMPIGNLTAFLTYILQILMSVMMAVMMVILAPRAVASAERVEQVLDTAPSIADPPEPVTPARATGLVEFRNVTFGYPGSEQPVLHDLSFTFLPVRPARSSAGPEAARRPCSTSSRGSPTPPTAASWSTAWTSGTRNGKRCGPGSGWSRRRLSCSAAPSPATCGSAGWRPPRPTCGMLLRSPRLAISSRPWPASSTPRSTRAAPTSRAGSGSGCRSPGRW